MLSLPKLSLAAANQDSLTAWYNCTISVLDCKYFSGQFGTNLRISAQPLSYKVLGVIAIAADTKRLRFLASVCTTFFFSVLSISS